MLSFIICFDVANSSSKRGSFVGEWQEQLSLAGVKINEAMSTFGWDKVRDCRLAEEMEPEEGKEGEEKRWTRGSSGGQRRWRRTASGTGLGSGSGVGPRRGVVHGGAPLRFKLEG